jgi:hypothetical protein
MVVHWTLYTLYLKNLTQVKGFTLLVYLSLNKVEQPMSDHLS